MTCFVAMKSVNPPVIQSTETSLPSPKSPQPAEKLRLWWCNLFPFSNLRTNGFGIPGYSHNHGFFSWKIHPEWKEKYCNIGDTPVFHWSMILGGRAKEKHLYPESRNAGKTKHLGISMHIIFHHVWMLLPPTKWPLSNPRLILQSQPWSACFSTFLKALSISFWLLIASLASKKNCLDRQGWKFTTGWQLTDFVLHICLALLGWWTWLNYWESHVIVTWGKGNESWLQRVTTLPPPMCQAKVEMPAAQTSKKEKTQLGFPSFCDTSKW